MRFTRRQTLLGLAGVAAAGTLPLRGAFAASPPLPSSPVSINIVDVAGNLALTQKAFEAYAAANPKLVSNITFNKATSPELPGKLQAEEAAGRLDIDLVLSGTDALSAGIEQNLWVKLLPDHQDALPQLDSVLLDAANKMQALGQGYGVVVSYYPSGPLLEYMPDAVADADVPKDAAGLLAWTKANPNQLIYARPANSGPGRTFIMGLPYLLGDSDPKDPVNGWAKTWAYLKELGKNIEYYPTGTGAVMKELGEGTRSMTVTTTGWDINPRVLGTVPKEAKVAKLDGFHWVADAHYMLVPKGTSDDKLAVLLDLMKYMLTPAAQAYTYDEGYFYPGPAVKDVPLSMAPKESQDAINQFGRPEYADWIANNPIETPLEPSAMVKAFDIWDKEVGGSQIQK
ncbi:MAG TPA: extracellular solute-binding protein [Devosia sp.]|nr:extracellular solute-binding protein [Devosia sp.]